MLSFAPVALPVCLVGWLLLLLTGPRSLRGRAAQPATEMPWRVELPVGRGAIAVGRRAADIGIARTQEFVLESIVRGGESAAADERVEAGDRLVFAASEAGVRALWDSPRFGLAPQRLYAVSVGTGEHGALRGLEDDEMRVVAARTDRPLDRTPAVPGATVYVSCDGPQVLARHDEFTVWADVAGRAPQPGKTWLAVGILVAVVVAASFGVAPVALVAFSGAVLTVLAGVLTPRSAVRALDWNVLFILAGSVGLGAVVVDSGLAAQLARAIESVSAGNTVVVVLVLASVTTVLTNLVTNAAAASILTPVVIGIATRLGLDAVLLLGLLATCISFTFLNPFAHQTNLMVMGPGGYSTRTFVRFGIPLAALCLVTVCAVAWGLLQLR
jgi:hypothetical protein